MTENIEMKLKELDANTRNVYLTPEKAQEYLANQRPNREIKQKNLYKLINDLSEDRFVYNGDPLRFDKYGKMGDGQHRCLACIKTGKPFYVLTVRGLPDEAFPTIDIGSNRSPGDILKFEGITNANNKAAAVRIREALRNNMLSDKNGTTSVKNSSHDLSPTAILILYSKEAEIYDNASLQAGRYRGDKRNYLQQSYVTALIVYLTQDLKHPSEKVLGFFNQLFMMRDAPCNAINLLRDNLIDIKNPDHKKNYPKGSIPNWTAKAWNAYISGKDYKMLRWNAEEGSISFL